MKTPVMLCSAFCTLLLAASPAVSDSLPPLAAFESTGVLSYSGAGGLSITGDLSALFRQPAPGERPYIYSTSFGFGSLSITPDITITIPEITIVDSVCLPFLGCSDPVVLPSQALNLNPAIPLFDLGTIFEGSVQSSALPIGDILAFDYGTPLFGAPLSFGDLVQNQFETGDASVSVADGFGPFGVAWNYDGELQPGGEEVFATYSLNFTGPGFFDDIETLVLGLINDSIGDFSGIALELFLATDPCSEFGAAAALCNGLLSELDPSMFGLTVNGIGTLSGDYWLSKSITPVPLPAALPMMASALGALGMMGWRRRKHEKLKGMK